MTPNEKETALYATRFTFRRLGYVAAVVGVVLLGHMLRGVLLPLFLAFLLAFALDPLIGRLNKLGVPRAAAAPLLMLAMVGAVVALTVVAVPYFFNQFTDAASALPGQLNGLRTRVEPTLWSKFHVKLPHTWSEVTTDYGELLRQRLPALLEGAIPAVFGTFNAVVVLAGSLIIPVFALYLLMDLDVIVRRASVLVPRRYAAGVEAVAVEIHDTLGRYVLGQITASMVLAAVYAIGLGIVGIKLAVPIGVMTGLLAFVPYVGFGTGLLMAVGMAVLDWQGVSTLVGVLVVMGIGQLIDAFLVTPRIVGGSVGLKPIEVLLTMMVAATLFGFVGVLLAVPLGAVVKILLGRATDAYLQSRFYRQIPPPATPTPLPGAIFVDAPITRRPDDVAPAPAPRSAG